MNKIRVPFLLLLLVCVQGLLSYWAALRNSATFDEIMHVPVGLTYWEQGQFHRYAHNPPLIRCWMALPLYMMGIESSADPRQPPIMDRAKDGDLGERWRFGRKFRGGAGAEVA